MLSKVLKVSEFSPVAYYHWGVGLWRTGEEEGPLHLDKQYLLWRYILGGEYVMATYLNGREMVVLQEWMVLEDWKCYYWALECGILMGIILKYVVCYGNFAVAGLGG